MSKSTENVNSLNNAFDSGLSKEKYPSALFPEFIILIPLLNQILNFSFDNPSLKV